MLFYHNLKNGKILRLRLIMTVGVFEDTRLRIPPIAQQKETEGNNTKSVVSFCFLIT